MGLIDRKYMSDPEDTRLHVAGVSLDMLRALIFANVGVWVFWLVAQNSPDLFQLMKTHFMLWPERVFSDWHLHTLLTSAFSHQGFWHLLYNMVALWFLGEIVQQYLGQRNLLVLYLACGLAGSLGQIGLDILRPSALPCLGASGAVMGIAVVAAFIEPQRIFNIYIAFFPIPIKLWVMVAIYIAMDLSGVLSPGGSDHIGHGAHLGGALAGFLFYRFDLHLFQMRRSYRAGLGSWFRRWWRRPNLRVVERSASAPPPRQRENIPLDDLLEPSLAVERSERRKRAASHRAAAAASTATTAPTVDPATAKRVDDLLGKISAHGVQALNDEERDFLHRASQKLRKW